MAFNVTYNDEDFEIDNFTKVLLFQQIIDMEIDKNIKSLLLYIHRKTLCFDKLHDRLAMFHLQKKLQLSELTLRKIIKEAETKDLIKITRSRGGDMKSSKRFNLFMISPSLLSELIDNILEIREENGFN